MRRNVVRDKSIQFDGRRFHPVSHIEGRNLLIENLHCQRNVLVDVCHLDLDHASDLGIVIQNTVTLFASIRQVHKPVVEVEDSLPNSVLLHMHVLAELGEEFDFLLVSLRHPCDTVGEDQPVLFLFGRNNYLQ